ncbi:hypothetical protein [Halorussus salinus]|uniref:hypothetical protein n=1 Tax=Halorussus salinus TaxID=1364935 RepID=UPI001092E8A9|nr:hypothetical protein [Halorussus salinus]
MVKRQVKRKRNDIILLSIDPQFSEEIFSGKKEYEFRKPSLPKDLSYVVLMENGYRHIVGGFSVGSVYEGEIASLWENFGKDISVKDRFMSYFEGWETGLAIEVDEIDKFEEPISVEDITKVDDELKVPNQFSFIYLTDRSLRLLAEHSNLIGDFLPNTTLYDWIDGKEKEGESELDFRLMVPEEEDQFRKLFSESPVPSEYADITDSFIDHIVQTHEEGEDPYGYFTKKKEIYTLLVDNQVAGFSVTTWKRGGSVKYGPTMLKTEYRGRGLGPQFRERLDKKLKEKNVRKTYSTIPETAHQVLTYLLKSGYKTEAHMINQYSEDHSELVCGKLLRSGSPQANIHPTRESIEDLEFSIGSSESNEFEQFILESMEPWYNEIDDSFVKSVQKAENRELESEYHKKGKRVYIGGKNDQIECVTIASLKRGGGIKISPFLTRVTGESITKFLEFVENDLREVQGARKLYTHVPLLDSELLSFFTRNGYGREGLIREPYKEGIDMVFLGKFLDS